MTELTTWIFNQSVPIVIMGIIIYGLYKTLKDKDAEIKRLNEETKEYANDYKAAAKEFTEVFTLVKDRLSK